MFRPLTTASQAPFRQGLSDYGYVEGRNIVVLWRSAEGKSEAASRLAAELASLPVDVIVAEFTPMARAARDATRRIPIVMAPVGDPVAAGLAGSMARPGGNATGFSNLAAELAGKRLGLLRELVPGLSRIGLLVYGADPLDKAFIEETRSAAAKASMALSVETVARPESLTAAFENFAKAKVGAIVVPANLPAPGQEIARLALAHRLPSVSLVSQFVDAGGLMAYGASVTEIQRRAAGHVARILGGARPADIPIESPSKFELAINAGTAKAIGLSIPSSLRLLADRVIE